MAFVKARRLLYGLRLRSLGGAGGALWAGIGVVEWSLKRPLVGPLGPPRHLSPFLASYGLRDRCNALRLENGLRLRSRLPRYGEGDREGWRLAGGDASHLPLDAPLGGFRSSDVSMRSALLDRDRDRDRDTEYCRPGRFLSLRTLRLRDRALPFILCGALPRAFSSDVCARADLDLDWDRVLRRPRSSGLKELKRRRVFLSTLYESREVRESADTERLLLFRNALSSCSRRRDPWCFLRGGERDGERKRFVDMVETESTDDVDGERTRLRSSSFFFKISSAIPFFRTRSSGTSVVSLGFSLGFSSCWVLDGRDL